MGLAGKKDVWTGGQLNMLNNLEFKTNTGEF